MKPILFLSLLFTVFNVNAYSGIEDNVYYSKPHTRDFISEFFTFHPELIKADSFIYLAKNNKKNNTEIFVSKNMNPGLTQNVKSNSSFFFTPLRVSCNVDEDEICITTTKNNRIIEQSCMCIKKKEFGAVGSQ